MKYITGGDLIYPVAFPSMLFWAYCLVGAILRHFYKPNLNPNSNPVNCTNLQYPRSLRSVMMNTISTTRSGQNHPYFNKIILS